MDDDGQGYIYVIFIYLFMLNTFVVSLITSWEEFRIRVYDNKLENMVIKIQNSEVILASKYLGWLLEPCQDLV